MRNTLPETQTSMAESSIDEFSQKAIRQPRPSGLFENVQVEANAKPNHCIGIAVDRENAADIAKYAKILLQPKFRPGAKLKEPIWIMRPLPAQAGNTVG